MEKLAITIACEAYDRVAALTSGSVQIQGCRATVVPLHAEELFLRTIAYAEFDVSELSLSSTMLATSRGDFPYVEIPVFPSRPFRHSAIYVNAAAGIQAPADLRGKLVGVPEYQMTAALWARGLLSDQHGVRSQDMRWRTGGLETPGRSEKIALRMPEGFEVMPIGPQDCLSDMLAAGRLDAIVSARAPSCFGRQAGVARLFPRLPHSRAGLFSSDWPLPDHARRRRAPPPGRAAPLADIVPVQGLLPGQGRMRPRPTGGWCVGRHATLAGRRVRGDRRRNGRRLMAIRPRAQPAGTGGGCTVLPRTGAFRQPPRCGRLVRARALAHWSSVRMKQTGHALLGRGKNEIRKGGRWERFRD